MPAFRNDPFMKKNILITDRFSLHAKALLKAQDFIEVYQTQSHIPTQEELQSANALIIRSRTKVDMDFLEKAPNLEVIITSTSGYDHIDLEATLQKNIKTFYTPEANAQSTAELTWFLILAAARDLNVNQKMILSSKWERTSLKAFELSGKVIGVIGLGRVGLRVAKIAQAFGMKVMAYDPYKDDDVFKENKIERVGYTEILRMAHVVSFHVPYTKETHQMFNRRLFEDCHEGLIVVNASRGNILNEHDVHYGLETGIISRAALDVFIKEPLEKDSNIFSDDRVIRTPHIGATTEEAFEASSLQAAQKCIDYFKGQSVSDQLPPESPWWKYQFRRS